jgi:O-antigen/teichoic acid export membrane protein
MSLRKIFSNSAALLCFEIVSKALPLITFPQIARALGPTNYGKIGFVTSLVGFFSLLSSPGFSTYGTREVAQDPGRARALMARIMGARLTFACISYLLLAAFTFTLAPPDPVVRSLILLTGLGLLVSSLDLQWLFAGQSRMWMIAITGIVAQVTAAALILILINEPGDAGILALVTALSPSVAVISRLIFARRNISLSFSELLPSAWRDILPVCFTLGLAGLMSLIYGQIDLVLLRYFRSDTEVGLYAASTRILGLSMSVIFIVGQVFFPLVYKAAKEGAAPEQKFLQWMWDALLAVAVPVSVGGMLLARPLTAFFLGPEYAEAEPLVRWLMPNVLATALAIYFGGRLVPHHRERRYLYCVIAGAGTNVVVNLMLMPRYGAMAAALATILSQIAVAFLASRYTRDLPAPRMVKSAILTLAASVVMVISLIYLQQIRSMHLNYLLVYGALIYGAAYWLISRLWRR